MTALSAAITNFESPPSYGCDAFAHNQTAGIWVMADGANSCPGARQAAEWVVDRIVTALEQSQPITDHEFESCVLSIHSEMLLAHPETAATLLICQVCRGSIRLASIGDSSLRVFRPPTWPLSGWKEYLAMPRDIDRYGNPTQLIGSEVCEKVHLRHLKVEAKWLLVFMTDGAAEYIQSEALGTSLATLGRQQPSSDDLEYLCRDLSRQALNAGCRDDVSIAMVWFQGPHQ
jgi:serine/threonine protein phosphatase PrpC